jgi:Icc-related predicted phosphoesterase
MKLKIVAVSDLHGYLPEITEPADIAIIAGDIMPLAVQFDRIGSKLWLETEFTYWVNNLPVDEVFLVAGNHDAYFENISKTNLSIFLNICNRKLNYLRNEVRTYFDSNGLAWTIFGTPYCHIYGNWPFMRTEEYMTEKFKQIPDKVDIIISHDPPFAVGDADVILDTSRSPVLTYEHLGNPSLANRINNVDYKLLVCGHIHGGDHEFNPIFKIVNVSQLNEGYKPYYKPFYIEIEHDW